MCAYLSPFNLEFFIFSMLFPIVPNCNSVMLAAFINVGSANILHYINLSSRGQYSRLHDHQTMNVFSSVQVEVFHKNNGLSDSLMLGCRVVLKERKVVLGLMSKCETISSKMVKRITEVMEKGTGSTKQPNLLNSQ